MMFSRRELIYSTNTFPLKRGGDLMKKKSPRSVEPIEGVVVAETGLLVRRGFNDYPAGGHISLRIRGHDAARVQHR